jgi:uncharacterized protein YneF (UPF0154 family)
MEDNQEEEMSVDVKHDIKLAFNLYKNEKNQINKLKLRTILFSMVMYKSSASDINQFIEEQTSPEKEWFNYDDVCKLVKLKHKFAKEKEAEEVYNFLCGNAHKLTEESIKAGFDAYGVGVSVEEIQEMMKYMIAPDEERKRKMEEERKRKEEEEAEKRRKEEEEKKKQEEEEERKKQEEEKKQQENEEKKEDETPEEQNVAEGNDTKEEEKKEEEKEGEEQKEGDNNEEKKEEEKTPEEQQQQPQTITSDLGKTNTQMLDTQTQSTTIKIKRRQFKRFFNDRD